MVSRVSTPATADLATPRGLIGALSAIVDVVTVAASGALLAGVVLTMFVGVIYRYVLNDALPWTEEVAGACMVWLVFVGAVMLYRRQGHPAITIVTSRLTGVKQQAVETARDALVGAFFAALALAGTLYATAPQPHTPALGLSYSLLYASIPAAATLALIHWLDEIAHQNPWRFAVSLGGAGIVSALILAAPAAAFHHVPPAAMWLLLPVFFALGIPIAIVLGLASIVALATAGVPLSIVAQRLYAGIDNPAFLAIPAFMLTGALMETSGMSEKLVGFASSLVGRFRGGLAHADVLASVLFADTSGSAVADTAAIGAVMMPGMRARGYREGFVVAHQAASGSLGTLFPPSISMIIFATVTSVSITGLFLASLIPGFMVAATYMLIAYIVAHREGYPREAGVPLRELGAITWRALPSLVAPVVVLGGILGGIFTPYEAGAVAAVYVAAVALLSGRGWRMYGRALIAGASTAAMVMFIIANASIVAWVTIGSQIPQRVAASVALATHNPILVLILICILLSVLAIFLEPPAILIAVIPICMPIVQNAGVAPLHFGVIVMLTTAIGMLLPPIGITLIVSAGILKVPIERAARSVIPYVAAVAIDLVAVILFPQVATWLPAVARH